MSDQGHGNDSTPRGLAIASKCNEDGSECTDTLIPIPEHDYRAGEEFWKCKAKERREENDRLWVILVRCLKADFRRTETVQAIKEKDIDALERAIPGR